MWAKSNQKYSSSEVGMVSIALKINFRKKRFLGYLCKRPIAFRLLVISDRRFPLATKSRLRPKMHFFSRTLTKTCKNYISLSLLVELTCKNQMIHQSSVFCTRSRNENKNFLQGLKTCQHFKTRSGNRSKNGARN